MRDKKYLIRMKQILFPIIVLVGMVSAMYGYALKSVEAESVKTVVRGVVDQITELPQYNKDIKELEVGKAECPFVVLEVVPYEEYAEIGYMIGGCEPLDTDYFEVQRYILSNNKGQAEGTIQWGDSYFFKDEDGYHKNYKDGNPHTVTSGVSVSGYLERVEDGTGNLSISVYNAGNEYWYNPKNRIEVVENGNWIWVTTGQWHDGEFYDEDTTYEVGDRIYCQREASETDEVLVVSGCTTYKNKEQFLKNTLHMSDEEASNFSIVVKTITPEELNKNPKWIDYANLFYISPKSHDTNFRDGWKKYNRLGKTSSVTTYDSNPYYANDISGEVALKIFQKITMEEGYAPAIFDDNVYNNPMLDTTSVQLKVHDFQMKDTGLIYTETGTGNNMYKLCVMLFSINSDVLKYFYFNEESPYVYVNEKGQLINALQEGTAATHWCNYTFMQVPSLKAFKNSGHSGLYGYWSSKECKLNYGYVTSMSAVKYTVDNHCYAYPGNNSMTSDYLNVVNQESWKEEQYSHFHKYLIEIGAMVEDENGNLAFTDRGASNSDAISFVLNFKNRGKVPAEKEDRVVRILDVEPSVEVTYLSAEDNPGDGSYQNGCNPFWSFTEIEARMLLLDFKSRIEITHMTTAEFNGKAECLTSKYDLIYLGTDLGGYTNQVSKVLQLSGGYQEVLVPEWNDGSNYIIRHTGDSLLSAEFVEKSKQRTRTVTYNGTNSTVLHFPGNDITDKKRKALLDYVKAGYPIVAEKYLYNAEKAVIEEDSFMYQLMETLQKKYANKVFCENDAFHVKKEIENNPNAVSFRSLPNIYNGTTKNSESAKITNPNYLTKKNGKPNLSFTFDVKEAGYRYEIYIDQNNNSKFTKEDGIDEVMKEGSASIGSNTVSLPLSSSYSGLISWQIVVYRSDNPAEQYIRSGCSAVQNTSGKKTNVKVLQIMPDENGTIDLSKDAAFTKYYDTLDEYQMSITAITLSEYLALFEKSQDNRVFQFDISSDISMTQGSENPVNLDCIKALPEEEGNMGLLDFNMIIIGFGDCYGGFDFSNENGAAEFIEYFIAAGKSVLFSHDFTSLYNKTVEGKKSFGYTPNALLRDFMGMNAYGLVSTELDQLDSTGRLTQQLKAYQQKNSQKYSTILSQANQGYTYYALKRLGWYFMKNDHPDKYDGVLSNWVSESQYNRMLYKGMIVSPASSLGEEKAICSKNVFTEKTGFNNNNDYTTVAEKTNTGQITEYPFKIDTTLQISKTHGQWYQLSLEDEDVTVWYTLADDGQVSSSSVDTGDGTGITYGVSPRDAANNYYIYSKGNVFYTGIGHSQVEGDMEAKLLINTMVNAYRASYVAPEIEITNQEATVTAAQTYSIEIPRNYESIVPDAKNEDSTNQQSAEIFTEEDKYKVVFSPVEYNVKATDLYCTIAYKVGEEYYYFDRVVDEETNQIVVAKEKDAAGNPVFSEFRNGHEYSLEYPKSYLDRYKNTDKPCTDIVFGLKNDLVDVITITKLKISASPLFQLD